MDNLTKQKIIEYITENTQVTANSLYKQLGISRQAVHKNLNKLMFEDKIYKIGTSPTVYYLIKEADGFIVSDKLTELENEIADYINDTYMIISPLGERLEGLKGIYSWCNKNNLPINKTANDYVNTLKKYYLYKKDGYINGTAKLKSTFSNIYVDKLFYVDFYSIDRFGKTKLGQLLLLSKQSQNRKLIREVIEIIRPKLEKLISDYNIDAIGYIPPTVKRETQFMKELENELKVNLPLIKIKKVRTPIVIPQKTLSKLNDRVENAKRTIIVDDKRVFKNILLIDDAVGSGATINETAKQLKKNCTQKIIGLSVVGSYKGFDVISEV